MYFYSSTKLLLFNYLVVGMKFMCLMQRHRNKIDLNKDTIKLHGYTLRVLDANLVCNQLNRRIFTFCEVLIRINMEYGNNLNLFLSPITFYFYKNNSKNILKNQNTIL
jgi:hypothetical protein